MSNKPLITICVLIFTFIYIGPAFGGDSLFHKFPSAVLVQLRSEQNKIIELTKQGDYKTLTEVKKDAVGVSNAMINDFNDHFDYCPVYYYMDTNLALIMNRSFEGVLMGTDGAPAKNLIVNDKSADYLVVYYGYPTSQARTTKTVTDSQKYEYNSGEPYGKGLIINNYKFQQVAYLYRLGYQNFFFIKWNTKAKNAYESKHYDMEYFPCAANLNKELVEGKIRIANSSEKIDHK